MLDKNNRQTPELSEELQKRNIGDAKSVFINMRGTILHALYLPPKNSKLVVVFHGIKGNWLNNPIPVNPAPEDADYNPRYRMELLEEFARDGFGFLACTMPGFNPSQGRPSEANFHEACRVFAAHTANLAFKLNLKPHDIIVCGESLGGAIATIFAGKLTQQNYPPGVLSLIASFDSLIGMTANEFPIFSYNDLKQNLTEKLDTTENLKLLNPDQTYLHIVATNNDRVVPIKNTLNLREAATKLGFNILYHQIDGNHTTWDKPAVISSKKLTHLAREKQVAIAMHHTVEDIEKICHSLS